MTDPNYTHIGVVMDRSGSMSSIASSAQQALDEFINGQKAVPGKATMTFTQFDNEIDVLHDMKPLEDIPYITLQPRGSTALLDAIGLTVVSIGDALAALSEDERPGHVLIAILTDGHENASKEWTREKVLELITTQREQWNWDFIYLATDEAGIDAGVAVGIPRANTMTWAPTEKGAGAAYASVGTYTTSLRTTGRGTFEEK